MDDEIIVNGYIVKSKLGEVTFFSVMPVREENFGEWMVYGACIVVHFGFNDKFKNLEWKHEPMPYELVLRKPR